MWRAKWPGVGVEFWWLVGGGVAGLVVMLLILLGENRGWRAFARHDGEGHNPVMAGKGITPVTAGSGQPSPRHGPRRRAIHDFIP